MNSTSVVDTEEAAAFFKLFPTSATALLLGVCIAFSLASALYLYHRRRELNSPQAIV